VDADGFPLFPAMPGGRRVPVEARSLARLVAGIRGTAVLTATTDSLAAMVVFLDREPVDGVAVAGERRVTGPEVLDEIDEVPVDAITVTEVSPELALVLGSYFLPTAIRQVPASVVVPDQFIRSLGRPGQRGCVLVKAGGDLGLVFIGGGQVRLACRADGEAVGGLEQVTPLLEDPAATLWARVGPDPGLTLPVRPEPPVAGVGMPQASAPLPPPPPLAVEPGPPPAEQPWFQPPPPPPPVPPPPIDAPYVVQEVGPPPPPPFAPPPGPPEPPPAFAQASAPPPPPVSPPPPGQGPALVGAVLDEVRQVLGPHAVRVEGVFLHAEPTVEGLRAAAESLPDRRIRLVSRSTLELVASRALAVLDRAGA
jgi:hypothetical protein